MHHFETFTFDRYHNLAIGLGVIQGHYK